MSIRLESLSVTGLGPIPSLQVQFGDINLIYGKNEKGKTFLTEYILRSLFRAAPKTRQLPNSGQVLVSGIEKTNLSFTPTSKRKLEDYLFSGEDSHPVDLSRLCVVKGGDLSFQPQSENAIDKNILKSYLSDQRVFDRILKDIPASTQESYWEENQIHFGRQAANIKELSEKINRFKQIQQLMSEVNDSFFQGSLSELKQQHTEVNKQINDQLTAKRSLAFQLSEQKKETEKQIDKVKKDDLNRINNLLIQLDTSRSTCENLTRSIATNEKATEHYNWVQTAITEIQKRPQAQIGKAWIVFFILGLVFLLAALVFPFLNQPFLTLGAGVLTIVFVILGIWQNRRRNQHALDNMEVNSIFTEFQQRFGIPTRSLATIIAKEKELGPKFTELTTYQHQLADEGKRVFDFTKEIKSLLSGLLGRKIGSKEEFLDLLTTLQKKYEDLTDTIQDLKEKLAKLDIAEDDFIQEKIKIDYDPTLLRNLLDQKDKIEGSKKAAENELVNLRNSIRVYTGDDLSTDWEVLLENLRKKRDETRDEMIHLKAVIGAGIAVTGVINQMKLGEDERIVKALSSDAISKPLYAITHEYNKIELEENSIVLSNKTRQVHFSDLSTGAQEQALLALRIGIAEQLLQDQKMFLILDDAFQHSDWERREWLVDEMADLANIGWQIIYFSMDDHIKKLFEERIMPIFKDRYQTFELKSVS